MAINQKVSKHYEFLLDSALDAPADELCEMRLNQSMGMAEYGYLIHELTHAEFNRECQRMQQIRTTRMARGVTL